jgi:hypothetical protein
MLIIALTLFSQAADPRTRDWRPDLPPTLPSKPLLQTRRPQLSGLKSLNGRPGWKRRAS